MYTKPPGGSIFNNHFKGLSFGKGELWHSRFFRLPVDWSAREEHSGI